MLTDIESARNILQKQIDILSQISKVVKLDIDRLSNAGSVLTSVLNKIGKRILHLEIGQSLVFDLFTIIVRGLCVSLR
jgi:ABC-type molybdate transport system ATPase subunit